MKLELYNARGGEIFDSQHKRRRVSALKTSPILVNLPYDVDYKDSQTICEDVQRQIPCLPELRRYKRVGFSIGAGHELGTHVREGVIYPVQLYVGRRNNF